MDTNKGLAKHEEMLPGRWTGSMRWTGFPCRRGGEGEEGRGEYHYSGCENWENL